MSQPHQIARNTIAPTVRKTPTPLTKVERTLIVVVPSGIGRPLAVTVMRTGAVPEPRVSTATRTVVLRDGGSATSRSAPSGKSRRSLSSFTWTVTSWSLLLRKLIGISALLDVMVMVPRRLHLDLVEEAVDRRADRRRAASRGLARPSGLAQSADTDDARARSALQRRGVVGADEPGDRVAGVRRAAYCAEA